ncbi:MAG: hypothetical protein BroJett007_01200 [Chloroflexota bacterium]|nr:MAG: hypothetical protein BroJett007_01200 [Chloroflexota bacterium]
MNVALILLLGGGVVTLWLYLFTRQRSAAKTASTVKITEPLPGERPGEGLLVVRGLGQVVHANPTLKNWLGLNDDVPDLEQITRLIQPPDNFLGLLGSQREAAFRIGDRWMEAVVYDVPHESDRRRMIVVRQVGAKDTDQTIPSTSAGLDFSRAFRVLNQASELVDITAGVEPTLQAILTVLHPVIHFDGGEINLFTEDNAALTPQAWFGDARYILALYERGGQYPLDGGLPGWILENRKALVLNSPADIEALRPIVSPFPYASVVGIPLELGAQVLGTLQLYNDRPGAYSQQDATLLLALNDALTSTISEAQQYAQQVRRVEDLVSLQALVEQVSGRGESRPEAVYGALAKRVAELSSAQMCGVLLYDETRGGLTAALPFHGIPDALARSLFVALPTGSAARDIFERQPYWLAGDLRDEPLAAEMGLVTVMSTIGIRNTLWVPLQISRDRIGMLAVFNKLRGGEFTIRDVANLRAIASQATVVVESTRLLSREQRLDAELEGLQQMTLAIGSLAAETDFYRALSDRISTLMNVRMCALLLFDREALQLRCVVPATGLDNKIASDYAIDFAPGSVFRALWEDEDSWYTNNTAASALIIAAGLEPIVQQARIQRTMFARLTLRGQLTGVIQIASPDQGRDFDDGDGRLLTIFATQAATILENARLFQEIQRASQRSESLRRIAELAGAMNRLDEVAQDLLMAIAEATLSPIAYISILDGAGNLITTPERVYGEKLEKPTVQSMYAPMFQHSVVMSRRPYLGNDVLNDERVLPEYKRIAGEMNVLKSVLVPLAVGDRSIGELGIANRGRDYTSDDIELMMTIASQVAPAVDRALLYEATGQNLARRLEELDAVSRVSNELTLTVDFDQILNVIRREALRATSAGNSTVALLAPHEEWSAPDQPVLARRLGGLRDTVSFDTIAPIERQAVIAGAEPVLIHDYHAPDSPFSPIPRDARSALSCAILWVDTVIGVIHLWDNQPEVFDDTAAQFLYTLATKASLGYGNYIRYNELRERSDALRQRVEQLNRIFELSSVLSSTTDPVELMEAVAFSVQNSAGFDQVVMLLADDEFVLHRVAQAGIPVDIFRESQVSTLTTASLRALLDPEYHLHGTNVCLIPAEQRNRQRDALETRFDGQREIQASGPETWHDGDLLVVQMIAPSGRTIGAMLLDRPFNDLKPDRTTVDLLETFAYQAANAAESTTLYNQAVRLRMLNEAVVNSIQQGIVVINETGRIVTINHTMREAFQWTDRAIGYTLEEYRPELAQLIGYAIDVVLAGGQPQEMTDASTYDHEDRPQTLNMYVYPLAGQQGSGAVLLIEDTTERRALEQAIQVRADQLGALTLASNRVTASTERSLVILNAMTEMHRLLPYQTMAVWRRAGSVLTLEDAAGELWEGVRTEAEAGEEATRLRINDYLALRQVVDSQRTLAVNLPPDEPTEYDPMPPGAESALSWLGVPMVNQGNVVGVIALATPEANAYDSPSDQNVAFAFASQVANAASSAELFMQAFERTNEMSTLLEAAQATAATRDLNELLELIAGLMFGVVEVDQCLIMAWNEIEDNVEIIQDTDRYGDLSRLRERGERLDLAQYRAKSKVLKSREPLILIASDNEDVFGRDVTEMRERGETQRVLIPLVTADGAIGLVQLETYSREPLEITPQNLRMVRTLGGQLAVGIQSARLTYEMSNMVAESFALNDLSQSLSSSLSVEQMMDTIRTRLPGVLTASQFYVALFNDETGTVSFPIVIRDGETVSIPPRPLTNDEVGYVYKNNRMLSIGADYFTPDELRRSIGIQNGEGDYKSYMAVPITVGTKVYGAIAVLDGKRTRAFSLNDQRVLSTVAAQLAAVLENANLFGQISSLAADLERQVVARTQELEEERDRLDTLYQITSELARTLDMTQLEHRALEMLAKAAGADDGLIMRFDALTDDLVTMATLSDAAEDNDTPHAGEQIGQWLIDNGPELNVGDLESWPHYDTDQSGAGAWRSTVGAVLQASDGESLGVIVLLGREMNAFGESAMRLVAAAANQVAATINNAQLYALIRDQAERLGQMLRTEQEEAEKNAAILDSISDGVVLADVDGKVIVSNPAAQRLLGMSADELLGRPLSDLRSIKDGGLTPWIDSLLDKTQVAHEDDAPVEFRLTLFDSIINTSTTPVFSEGRFVGLVSVLRDITRDVEVDRMKSEFVSNVSHEFRTPLTPIKGFTEMLLLGALGPVTDPQKNTLGMIKTNVERLTVLVEDILDISRIDSGRDTLRVGEVNLAEVLREAIDKQRNRPQHKDKTRTLNIEISDELPPIQADRPKLMRIFSSILDNAFNYTQDGGTIGVRTALNGERVLVSVSDDGVGIPEQYREAVWRRFQRIDEHALKLDVSGTGLGLSIVKEMVDMHHGEVWFESQVGKGTTFHVALPLVQPGQAVSLPTMD